MKNKYIAFRFACITFCIFGMSLPMLTFAYSDVPLGSPLYPALEYLTTKGFVSGYADGTFQPTKEVNRVEALKMILVATELDLTEKGNGFPDIPNDAWFTPYVLFAQSKGVVKGNPDGNFVPGRQVNRAEFLKMMLEAFDVNPADYVLDVSIADVPENAWFAPYIRFATQFDIMTLDKFKNALPSQLLTRGDAAFLVYKILEVGNGLEMQTILSITENHLVEALRILQEKGMLLASLHVQVSQYFSDISVKMLPDNEVVLAAKNTTEAVQSLVGAYISAENAQIDDVILAAKSAWAAADRIHSVDGNGLGEMSLEIKRLAESIAQKARSIQSKVEMKTE